MEENLEAQLKGDYLNQEIGVKLDDAAYPLKKAFWSGAMFAITDLKSKRKVIIDQGKQNEKNENE